MPLNVEKISIALPPEMAAQVRQAVEAGEYSSSSEVIRDALREWTYKRQLQQNGIEELRELWREARRSSKSGAPAQKVLDRLERKYQAMVDTSSR
jgi:antitoxin ParD1/3/4